MDLSTQMYACRVVQKAIDHILTHQQAALIQEIEPHVIKCVKDMNGNHVIQKAIERIPAEHIQFVVDAFTGKVGELATHSYGCRVIQRVLENCTEPVKRTILTELHSYGPSLITDQYGNYVTQHMIVHGFVEDRERVIEQVMTNFVMYSKHKFASNVVEKCIMNGSNKMRHEMLMVVLEPNNEQRSGLFQLITDGFGNYVVRKY
jgi:mRNA-binding protein PUF3